MATWMIDARWRGTEDGHQQANVEAETLTEAVDALDDEERFPDLHSPKRLDQNAVTYFQITIVKRDA